MITIFTSIEFAEISDIENQNTQNDSFLLAISAPRLNFNHGINFSSFNPLSKNPRILMVLIYFTPINYKKVMCGMAARTNIQKGTP